MLSALTSKVQKVTEPLNAQAIDNAFYGFRASAAIFGGFRRQDSTEALSAQAIGISFYGLQRSAARCGGEGAAVYAEFLCAER